jgi:predicted P-loop ATPase
LKHNGGQFDKDDKLQLTSKGLVCLEELDAMDDATMNKLKSIMTARTIDERPPYERFSEHRKHLASFCGTGNNRIFINDRTGTRRWLPFEVESILSPRDFPLDYEGIYSEAYTLYKEGFQYWFSPQEEELLKQHNKAFEVPHPEEELVSFYFRLPDEMQTPAFYPTSVVLDIITRTSHLKNVSCVSLGRVLAMMGYESGVVKRHHGYYLERRKDEEVHALPHVLAYEGRHGIRQNVTDDTDGF